MTKWVCDKDTPTVWHSRKDCSCFNKPPRKATKADLRRSITQCRICAGSQLSDQLDKLDLE